MAGTTARVAGALAGVNRKTAAYYYHRLREVITYELASKYTIHPNQISQWKRQAKENMVEIFSGKKKKEKSDQSAEIRDLHAKVGQLTMENDFLSRAFGHSLGRGGRK